VLLALAGLLVLLAAASPARAAGPYALEIEYPGFGYGEVLCKEGAIEAECEWEYESVTKLTLIPVAEEGSEFVGFRNGTGSAEKCIGLEPCTITLKANSYIEAVFEPIVPSLVIKYPREEEGEVACRVEGGAPEACESKYEWGIEITLVPEAFAGSEFVGFREGRGSAEECVGLEPCSFVLEADSSIEAPFVPIMHALTIVRAGSGQGTIACNGFLCAATYAQGSEVTLKAIPASGSTFAGWSGEGCSGTGSCLVTVEADAAVTATFQADPEPPPPPPVPEGTAKAAATAKVKQGKARLGLSCAGGPCEGTLKLTAKVMRDGKRKSLTIGRSSFALGDGSSEALKVKLSAPAMRQLRKARSLRGRVGGAGVAGRAVKLTL
jgi:Divergent InlB B-repeat domain